MNFESTGRLMVSAVPAGIYMLTIINHKKKYFGDKEGSYPVIDI